MLEPLIYNHTYRIKDGRAEDCLRTSQELVRTLENNPTRHLYFAICIDEEGQEYSNLQIHPDPDSMVEHMQLAARQVRATMEPLDSKVGSELYGTPNAALKQQLEQWAPSIHYASMGFSDLMPAEQSAPVSGPLVFINSYGLTPGSGRAHEALMERLVRDEDAPPGLLHDKVYFDESGTQASNIQVYKSSSSATPQAGRLYWQRLAALKALIVADTMRINIVGAGGGAVRDKLANLVGPHVPIQVKTPTVGFSRLALE